MRDPNGGVGLVHVLTPGAARAVRVDAEVALVQLDVDVVGQQRRDDHLGEARVASVRLVEWAQADEPVHAALGLEDPVGVLALHAEGRRLEAGFLARAGLEQLGREPAVLRPAQVHAQQDLGPVLRVGAPGARVDGHERVARVVLAREQGVLLEPVELLAQRRDAGGDLVLHVAVHREQLPRVLVLLGEAAVAPEAPGQASVLGADLGRMALVVPEPGRAELLLELGDAALQLLRVKGNHGPRQAGPRSPRAAGRAAGSVSGRRSRARWYPPGSGGMVLSRTPGGPRAGLRTSAAGRAGRRAPRRAGGSRRRGDLAWPPPWRCARRTSRAARHTRRPCKGGPRRSAAPGRPRTVQSARSPRDR